MRPLFLLLAFCCMVGLHAQPGVSSETKTVLSYTFGRYTPFGLRFSIENNSGWGFYLESRLNPAAFTQNNYIIQNGRIDDAAWIWTYAGKKKYARADIYAGFLFPVVTHMRTFAYREEINVSVFAAGGMMYARYLYLYDRRYNTAVGSNVWVRDKDLGAVGFDMESGLQTIIKGKRIFAGCSGILHRTERMFVAGIGVPVYD